MNSFDAPYWNLAQAEAWVIYRDRSLVDGMAHATRPDYRALKIYGHPRHRHAIGTPTELHRALEDGRLTAWGMRSGGGDRVEEIPAFEWPALRIAPPLVHPTPGASMDEPWTRVRVESEFGAIVWPGEVAWASCTAEPG